MTNETGLSEREREILRLVATGASNKEIAQQLTISTNTVKVHLRNIFAKIGVVSRTEATLYAIREQIVPAPGGGDERSRTEGTKRSLDVTSNGHSHLQTLKTSSKSIFLFSALGIIALLLVLFLLINSDLSRVLGNDDQISVTTSDFNQWTDLADLPEDRAAMGAAVYNGTIYLSGGETQNGLTNETLMYDPASGNWKKLADKPTAVKAVKAVTVDDKIYFLGGETVEGRITSVLEVYNPSMDTWETRSPFFEPIRSYAAVAYNGLLYVFGGLTDDGVSDEVYAYNVFTDVWIKKTSMSIGKMDADAVVVDDNIFVLGGFDGQKPLSNNESYSPYRDDNGVDAWKDLPRLPNPRYGFVVQRLADTIYIIGGNPGEQYSKQPLSFSLLDKRWQNFNDIGLIETSDMSIVSTGGILYLIGGRNTDGDLVRNVKAYQTLYRILLPEVQRFR